MVFDLREKAGRDADRSPKKKGKAIRLSRGHTGFVGERRKKKEKITMPKGRICQEKDPLISKRIGSRRKRDNRPKGGFLESRPTKRRKNNT